MQFPGKFSHAGYPTIRLGCELFRFAAVNLTVVEYKPKSSEYIRHVRGWLSSGFSAINYRVDCEVYPSKGRGKIKVSQNRVSSWVRFERFDWAKPQY